MSRPKIRMNSLVESGHEGDKRSNGSPPIVIDPDYGKQRSNSLGDGRLSPGFPRERHSSNKLLKGAILHNLLHPLDFYNERKIRSRSNSCSDELDLEAGGPTTDINKSRSRPSSPTTQPKGNGAWPVYKPSAAMRRPKSALSGQMSCPPAPQTTPLISISQHGSTSPLAFTSTPPSIAGYARSPTPSSPFSTTNEFFSHSIKNPTDRHRDGHIRDHPESDEHKHADSSSSGSGSDSFSGDSSSYSSYTSSDTESDEEPAPVARSSSNVAGNKHSSQLIRSLTAESRRSSDPLGRAVSTEKCSVAIAKSPVCERRSSGPQKTIVDREPCRSTLSVPIPRQTPSSPGTSPSSRFLSLIVSGVNSVKKSSSHLALPKRKKKRKKKKKDINSWDDFEPESKRKKRGKKKNSTKTPDSEINKVSSVEKLYSIYDQIILEGQLHRRHSMEPERRRNLSGGNQSYMRGEDPTQAAILFRDSRGLPIAAPFLDVVPRSELERDETQILVKFFKHHRTYDLIPTSAKLVVFDTRLQVKKAFYALVHNGVRAAPLWDARVQQFIGMLTITDFIRILQNFYHTNRKMEELEDHTLELWRSLLHDDARALVSIGPDESLFAAIDMLITHQIHRLPVIDTKTGNVLYIITHKRILKFLYLYMNELPKPSVLQKTLSDVSIGTYENIQTATEETLLIEALDVFVKHRVSALPIVDAEGRLIDIYAKFDAINLAAKGTYNNLNVTLKEANEYRNEWFEGVLKCTTSETLEVIMDRIVKAEVHRLVVVDKGDTVIGILSLSDLLKELVLRPAANSEPLRTISVEDVMALTNSEAETISPEGSPDSSENSGAIPSTQLEPPDALVDIAHEGLQLPAVEQSHQPVEIPGA